MSDIIRRRIIYVDDVNYSLVSMKSRLKDHYEIYPAQSVATLFEIISHVRPDLIILDVNMPLVDGYEAIIRLKTDERYANIPVMFLTAKIDRESVRKGFNLGAADYVFKPVSDTDLIDRIECLFSPEKREMKVTEMVGIRPKIIYVDDVNFSLVSVKGRLKERYEVFPAQSVDTMFDILDHVTPDLILLDINMPNVDGWEAIRKLKSDRLYATIPVIFLTGKNDKDSIVRGFSLGAADYVSKPFSDPDLIERIEYHLNPMKREYASEDEDTNTKPCILAVDEVYSMLNAISHALSDDYSGSLKGMLQKKFAVLYTLREDYNVCMLSRLEEIGGFLDLKRPDLFLLDYKMLASDGFNSITEIREHPLHKKTPILLSSPFGTFAHARETFKYGATDYVLKPVNQKELRDKVAKYIKAASKQFSLLRENLDDSEE
ncbi:MAG: response regulator [Chitinispirillia bacterium]|nr:response regulator [Chitinispirillia bacterium]MCL2241293.1 response regulator [Chitinispirillia bacterium]